MDACVALVMAMLLTGIAIPLAGRSRETAVRVKCASNLRHIGQAILLYSVANGGEIPRTRYDPRVTTTVCYTAFSASNPFANDGPGPNDVTAPLYLLLRTTESVADMFVCPSTIATTEPWDYRGKTRNAFSNFPSRQYLSYSYANVYGLPTTTLNALPASFAVAADVNPGAGALTVLPGTAAYQMKAGNSPNHERDGQNVLHGDGHVEFHQSPFAGVAGDNIFTFGDSRTSAGAGINGAPIDGNDSVLLPTALDGPAPGPVSNRRILRWLMPAGIGLVVATALLLWRVRARRRTAT